MILRHLLAVALLPLSVAVVVPVWIARSYQVRVAMPASVVDWLLVAIGLGALGAGAALFAASLRRFATEGQGTLAPWDPPRTLVIHGPYRCLRNPMISGVLFVLVGEALLLRSVPHVVWAGTFAIINVIFIRLIEEPALEARFGESYREYRRHVRRFVPRLRAWDGRSR